MARARKGGPILALSAGAFPTRSVTALRKQVSMLERQLEDARRRLVDRESHVLGSQTAADERAREASATVKASNDSRSTLQQELEGLKEQPSKVVSKPVVDLGPQLAFAQRDLTDFLAEVEKLVAEV